MLSRHQRRFLWQLIGSNRNSQVCRKRDLGTLSPKLSQSQGNPSPGCSGNPVEEEAERVQEPEGIEGTKETQQNQRTCGLTEVEAACAGLLGSVADRILELK